MNSTFSSSLHSTLDAGIAPILGQAWLRDIFFKQPGSSELARESDGLFLYVLWVNIISFIIVIGLMLYFVWKYRRSQQSSNYQVSSSHNTPLELAWSIIPLLVMVPIFFIGFHGYINKLASPANAEEIRVTGMQWKWTAQYSNGKEADETMNVPDPSRLEGPMTQWKADTRRSGNDAEGTPIIVVPAKRAVRVMLTSNDVIHSFYIPGFRVKMDVFPNRYTSLTFTADEPGRDHVVWCAEYCGQNHSEMAAWIRVVSEEEFVAYKNKVKTGVDFPTPEAYGEYVAKLKGCRGCHSIDGTANTGPTWTQVYGIAKEFSTTNDVKGYTDAEMSDPVTYANYIRESVYDPGAKIHAGYNPQMNSYRGLVTEEQLAGLTAYIKSLSPKAKDAGKQ
jgi:cytochrome c oxidase subunit 2